MRRIGLVSALSGLVLLAGCSSAATTSGSAAPAAISSSPASSAAPSPVESSSAAPSTAAPSPASTVVETSSASVPIAVPPAESPPPAPGTFITTGDSQFGEILFDESGQAIYLFDKETTSTADCYDDCAVAWPPVLTDGAPAASGSVAADGLGTTPRSDGTTQVTYFGHPLYYYAHEGKYDVTCHNVDEFGGLWLVVTPAGEAAAA